jgi:hypothetical protein
MAIVWIKEPKIVNQSSLEARYDECDLHNHHEIYLLTILKVEHVCW